MENKAHIDGNGNIVIQGVDGATIIINPDNSKELRQLIMDFGSSLTDLPKEILKMIQEHQDVNSEIENGANLYLTVLAEMNMTGYKRLKFGLTITNLTKENRYFSQPFFKIYPKYEFSEGFEHDTFIMIPEANNNFPQKLEYGEQVSYSYEIKDGAYDMYQSILEKDETANIQAFSNTTVGELYESNQFSIKKLFEYKN